MSAVLVGVLVVSILLFRFWSGTAHHHRVWVAQVDGKKLRLEVKKNICTLSVDGVVILETPIESSFRPVTMTTGIRMRQCFRYHIVSKIPAFGGKEMRIESDWTHNNKGEVTLTVDDVRIPLVELMDTEDRSVDMAQQSILGSNPTIADPRWESLYKTLSGVCSVLDSDAAKTIGKLQEQLSSRFLILAELQGEDAKVIWADEEERETMIALVEKEIAMGLEVVRKLHQLSIEKRQSEQTEHDLRDVFHLLQQLEAEQELEETGRQTKKKLLQRMTDRRRI